MGGGALTRIAVTDAAWVAIVATLPATVDTRTIQRSFSGRKILVWLPNEVVGETDRRAQVVGKRFGRHPAARQ